MNIALLGCGVVGGGVLEIADKRADMAVKYVLVRRDKPELGEKAVKDINIILNDKEVDTVVEVMGGLSPAFEYVAAAMKAGKNVVTANKHLVAHYYKELVSLAAECGVAFRCTPAVGGGIPWLVNLERVKRLDSVQSFCGIMNGTTNFILDAMHTDGSDFSEVLAEAQKLGYAEADPLRGYRRTGYPAQGRHLGKRFIRRMPLGSGRSRVRHPQHFILRHCRGREQIAHLQNARLRRKRAHRAP